MNPESSLNGKGLEILAEAGIGEMPEAEQIQTQPQTQSSHSKISSVLAQAIAKHETLCLTAPAWVTEEMKADSRNVVRILQTAVETIENESIVGKAAISTILLQILTIYSINPFLLDTASLMLYNLLDGGKKDGKS